MRLPLVTVLNQLLLVVKQLLVQECCVLIVGALNDSIDRASLLAEATEDALGHVNVILGGAARSIGSGLRLNHDCESWAGSLTQLASNATLLTSWVSAQCVLSTEHRRKRSLLPWVVDNVIRLKSSVTCEPDNWPNKLSVEKLLIETLSDIGTVDFVRKLVTNRKSHILLVVQVLRIESVRVVVLAVGHTSVKMVYTLSDKLGFL